MGYAGTSLELKIKDFEDSPNVRKHIKLLLNSALGKFNQKQQHISNTFVSNSEEMQQLFQERGEDILGFNDLDENLCHVTLSNKSVNSKFKSRKTNPTVLAFITAKARIMLHRNIIHLTNNGFQPYYVDTDSILFSGNKSICPPLNFGLAFGQFKHELGETTEITEFQAYGRKNFLLRYQNQENMQKKMLAKVCGMTLNSKISQDEFSKLACERRPKITQVRNFFESSVRHHQPRVQTVTYNNVEIRCERRICQDNILSTKPWGYK